jgi:hypothetical protein
MYIVLFMEQSEGATNAKYRYRVEGKHKKPENITLGFKAFAWLEVLAHY